MIRRILHIVGFCQHSRTTFPQNPRGRLDVAPHVSCLDCGREFAYDLGKMSIAQAIPIVVTSSPCLKNCSSVKP